MRSSNASLRADEIHAARTASGNPSPLSSYQISLRDLRALRDFVMRGAPPANPESRIPSPHHEDTKNMEVTKRNLSLHVPP
jgi:hypothetical protein